MAELSEIDDTEQTLKNTLVRGLAHFFDPNRNAYTFDTDLIANMVGTVITPTKSWTWAELIETRTHCAHDIARCLVSYKFRVGTDYVPQNFLCEILYKELSIELESAYFCFLPQDNILHHNPEIELRGPQNEPGSRSSIKPYQVAAHSILGLAEWAWTEDGRLAFPREFWSWGPAREHLLEVHGGLQIEPDADPLWRHVINILKSVTEEERMRLAPSDIESINDDNNQNRRHAGALPPNISVSSAQTNVPTELSQRQQQGHIRAQDYGNTSTQQASVLRANRPAREIRSEYIPESRRPSTSFGSTPLASRNQNRSANLSSTGFDQPPYQPVHQTQRWGPGTGTSAAHMSPAYPIQPNLSTFSGRDLFNSPLVPLFDFPRQAVQNARAAQGGQSPRYSGSTSLPEQREEVLDSSLPPVTIHVGQRRRTGEKDKERSSPEDEPSNKRQA
ncbi:uncharacterized protein HMPREF1541_09891 [Cyphellophora europaea CBS 101466]|uniref:Uncharacterized protein n=1 Tax=Cyphellophora europaea (strain CBS 101466) TaxID=1220924 RepID=W2S8Q6_CYPE1|nr:uncharacterized protein HMPREF1541_09891 [Cyphellophora europaea CBS 101466]ETN45015.1 hypothetical protein HMPREF1541_09891 [Cyphellophora europaea CBS 101466]